MPDDRVADQRKAFIDSLRDLHHARESPHSHRAADARRQLAQLRHSLLPGRQYQGYEVVFRRPSRQAAELGTSKDQPRGWLPASEHEQDVWLLVGGLFALHPQPWRRSGPRSLGASMGLLDKAHVGSANRRFTQLLGRGRSTLPHHLRQAIRLLAGHDIPVHYGQLLHDLVDLLDPAHVGKPAARVRLRWAREFHMSATAEPGNGSDPADEALTYPEANQ